MKDNVAIGVVTAYLATLCGVVATAIYGIYKAFCVSAILGFVSLIPPIGLVNGIGNLCGHDLGAKVMVEIKGDK